MWLTFWKKSNNDCKNDKCNKNQNKNTKQQEKD